MSLKDKIKDAILSNPKERNVDIAVRLKTKEKYVRETRYELRQSGLIPHHDPTAKEVNGAANEKKQFDAKEEILVRRENAKVKALESNLKKVLADYGTLMDLYDNALLIQEKSKVEIPKININRSVNSQATPIVQWSDWHCEERIERKTTQGLNEFNPEIAAKRVDNVAMNTYKIVRKERQDAKIDQIVICLGGDFINNFLHEHDVQMNFMHPIEAVVFAKSLLVKALKTVAKYGNFKKITVMCIRGNHGRLTKRMQSSNDYKMNFEAIIYYMLKQELNDSLFEWHIPESELGYVEVYGKKIRMLHGHQISYQGGVGDLTIPTNKFIMKQDKTVKADWNLMHHYHRFWMPTANTSLNGSLCGWNSYALSCGFAFEPPLQTFHLLDAKKGFTVRTPIHCE